MKNELVKEKDDFKQTGALTETIWPLDWRGEKVHSALGMHFEIPAGWHSGASANALVASPHDPRKRPLPFAPLHVYAAQVAESGYGQLAKRMCAALEKRGAHITGHKTTIATRSFLRIDFTRTIGETALRCVSLCELLDDGQLVLCFTFADHAGAHPDHLGAALRAWHSAVINPPMLARRQRRLVNEEAAFQVHFPRHWFIDTASGGLTVVRQAGRMRTHPDITVQSDTSPSRPRQIEQMTDRLGWRFETAREAQIGGAPALAIDSTRTDPQGRVEFVRELVVQPMRKATHFVQLSTFSERADALDRLQGLFVWM
jgi:hypothetical protein